MPGPLHCRRAGGIALHQVFRLLATEFEITVDDPEVAAQLEYLVPHAEQDFPVQARFVYEVRRHGNRLEIAENGESIGYELCAEMVMSHLYRRVHQMAHPPLAHAIRLHAGLGVFAGRRFVVLGAKHAGKSTVLTALLYRGVAIHGDEQTVLAGGLATAFPRRFHLREDSLVFLPEVAALAERLPFVLDDRGRRLFAFDPALAGRPWRIDSAPLDDVFILEQNHGGQTRLAECPKYEAVQRVMSQCRPPVDGRPGWIGELARAVDRARTCVLYNGGVAATADAICDRLGA